MIKSYFQGGLRNLSSQQRIFILNIEVAVVWLGDLIGLWIWDEMSFNNITKL